MITAEVLASRLEDRFYRRSTALELIYWAKALMFDYFQGKAIAMGENSKTVESIVLRISNSSTNYRTFLFDRELQHYLSVLGRVCEKSEAVYGFNLILSDQKAQAIEIVQNQFSTDQIVEMREHGASLLISVERVNEEEIHRLVGRLHNFSYVLSLRDS